MTNPAHYVETIDGWSLYLEPVVVNGLCGWNYIWRCWKRKYGVLCAGHVRTTERAVAHVIADLRRKDVIAAADRIAARARKVSEGFNFDHLRRKP